MTSHRHLRQERIDTRYSHFAFHATISSSSEEKQPRKEKKQPNKQTEKKKKEKNPEEKNNSTELYLFPEYLCSSGVILVGEREKNIASVRRIRAERPQ